MCHTVQSLDVRFVEAVGEVRDHGKAAFHLSKPEGNGCHGAGSGAGDRGQRRPLPSHVGRGEGAAQAQGTDQGADREIG